MSSNPAHVMLANPALTALPHPQVYHVRCALCSAITIHEVAADTVRMICPACEHRLTIPGAIHHECPHCHNVAEHRHILAGHSTSCPACSRTIVLEPILGRAWHQQPHNYGHPHGHTTARARRHPERTLAFSDSAERSLILVAAAIAMLIFVILVSMM